MLDQASYRCLRADIENSYLTLSKPHPSRQDRRGRRFGQGRLPHLGSLRSRPGFSIERKRLATTETSDVGSSVMQSITYLEIALQYRCPIPSSPENEGNNFEVMRFVWG